eukprot:m.195720 g.195720  ORF g.195720 m.195720 type:complete len:514 (-) comp19607_c0_seq1:61-1602(-)
MGRPRRVRSPPTAGTSFSGSGRGGVDVRHGASEARPWGFVSGALVGVVIALGAVQLQAWWHNHGGGQGSPHEAVPPLDGASEDGVDAARLNTLLEENLKLRQSNPAGARDQLRLLLAVSPLTPPGSDERRRVFDQLADTHAHLRNHSEAYVAHRQSFAIVESWARAEHAATGQLSRRMANEIIIAQVQLASDLYLSGQYDHALELSSKALQLQPPAAAQRVLLKLESTIHECKGDFVSALQRLEEALKLGKAADTDEVKLHLELLKRVASETGVPPEVRSMMKEEQHRLIKLLLSRGGFNLANQLPKHYHPGLTAKPWHDIATCPDPSVAQGEAVLRDAHAALLSEYQRLNESGRLLREQECIHDPTAGSWRRYEITGVWRPLDPATRCSTETPTACEVVHKLRGLGLRVIRAGYSAVAPSTWLKPHFGMSNGQLKFHLGLVVPTASNGAPCASMRVANDMRGWTEGGVSFFDDSFEHEVRNQCTAERVVFQVVFVHFDLQGEATAQTVFHAG